MTGAIQTNGAGVGKFRALIMAIVASTKVGPVTGLARLKFSTPLTGATWASRSARPGTRDPLRFADLIIGLALVSWAAPISAQALSAEVRKSRGGHYCITGGGAKSNFSLEKAFSIDGVDGSCSRRRIAP
ncbi:hypothetical protein X741_33660 [Mesorhizobium sp. LNHC229A00]|nr:hypothetical protein X741_33660 [Mesorhizobium sp. LNHC229A00]